MDGSTGTKSVRLNGGRTAGQVLGDARIDQAPRPYPLCEITVFCFSTAGAYGVLDPCSLRWISSYPLRLDPRRITGKFL